MGFDEELPAEGREEGRRHDGNGWGEFRGTRRSNETHESKTDPDAERMRKGNGQPAKLCFSANVLTANRCGLIADMSLVAATSRSAMLR